MEDDAHPSIDELQQMVLNGRGDEARRILSDLKEKAMYQPDKVGVGRNGKPTFIARGRHVKQDKNGEWVLAPKSKRP